MIFTENGECRILCQTPEELLSDTRDVISAFVKYNQSIQMPDKTIEETLVKMIVDGFNREGIVKFEDVQDE